GQGDVSADQAPRERGHDRPHRPRQDHADGRHVGAQRAPVPVGRGGGLQVDRQGWHRARRDEDRDHHGGPRGVRVGTPALRPRGLPRPRGLRQEHDHRRRPDGRRGARGVRGRRPDAPDARARAARPPGRRAGARRVRQQGGPRAGPGAARPHRDGDARAADAVRVRRRGRPLRLRLVPARARRPGRRPGQRLHRRADGGARPGDPGTRPGARQAVPDAGGERVLRAGPGDGRHRPHRARPGAARRGGGGHRLRRRGAADGGDRHRAVPQAFRGGRGRRQRRAPAPRAGGRRGRARPHPGGAAVGAAAPAVPRRGVRAAEGRGRPPHAVRQRLHAAVLLPHDRRDRPGHAGRAGDGDAGRQRGGHRGVVPRGGDGRVAPLRRPRGRPDGRLGRRDPDPGL
ncbi:MAG: Translation elongation factor Tu, partial [uncultured Phycisphaerae bacterium]